MSEKLKPCPFCGGTAHIEQPGTRRQSCIVECDSCGVRHESSDEGAMCGTSWNRRELESASQPGGGEAWTPVENAMPTGCGKVLATYLNSVGNARRIVARYIEPKSVEAHTDDYESCTEYDEATDTYWLAGGWYECIDNWGDYSQVQVCEGDISHWMPLPAAPSAGNGGAEGR